MIFETLFLALALLFLLCFYLGTRKSSKALAVLSLWAIALSLLALAGFFQDTQSLPPRFLIVLAGNIICCVYLYIKLADTAFSPALTLGIHALRFPLEWMLYGLFERKLIPELMTFEGYNYDILFGLSALIFLVFHQRKLPTLNVRFWLIWNAWGFISLGIIVVLAVLSAPSPIQQMAFDMPNRAVLHWPYILLPGMVVPIVVLTHLLSLKDLLGKWKFGRSIP